MNRTLDILLSNRAMSDKKESCDDSSAPNNPGYGTMQPPGTNSTGDDAFNSQPPDSIQASQEPPSSVDSDRTYRKAEPASFQGDPHLSQTMCADDEYLIAMAGAGVQELAEADKTKPAGRTLPDGNISAQAAKSPGKSTWNLRIMRRAIQGDVSGIINDIPIDPLKSTGLQSALITDDSVPAYEVVGQIGAGSMGNIYRATQTCLNRELAIKTLKPGSDSRNTEQDQAMFVSEAVVTANLVHPNIVPIHELGRTADGKLFYSMKQVEGNAWKDTIKETSQEENLDILLKVCDAVAYAHSRGVINRDLKPENVMVGEYGEVIVLDWGLAVTNDKFAKSNSVAIDFRGQAGTPLYMAPELMDKDIRRVQTGTDIYLLGAILFELLEGRQPHWLREIEQADRQEQFKMVVQAVVKNRIESNVTNKGELMQIARRAMETDPEDRYASVEEFQEAIREYRVTGRAEELMHQVEHKGSASYSEYQSAVALYDEALRKWPNNQRALEGDLNARQGYAELALRKGDLDLGLQILGDQQDRHFKGVRKKLKRTKRTRSVMKGTWFLATIAAVVFAIAAVAEKNKADIATVVAVAEKNKADIATVAAVDARKELEEKNGSIEKLNVQEKNLNIAVVSAELARKAAELAATKERNTANKIVKAAAAAAMEAKEAATSAAEKLADTNEAKAIAEQALGKAKTAELAAIFKGVKATASAKSDIREFDEVVSIIDEALEEHKFSDVQKKNLLTKKKAAQQTGNRKFLLDGAIDSSSMSPDGSTHVVYNSKTRTLTVFRDVRDGHVPPNQAFVIEPEGASVGNIAASNTGTMISVVSHNQGTAAVQQLWKWNGSEYAQMRSEETTGKGPLCLFSADSNRAYLLESRDLNSGAAVTVLDVSGERAESVIRHQFVKSPKVSGDFPQIHDAVLLPDETALILAVRGGCRSISIQWSADHRTPKINQQKINEIQFDFFAIPKVLSELGLESGHNFYPERLCLSPKGNRLAMLEGRRIVVLSRDEKAGESDFPFSSSNVAQVTAVLDQRFKREFTTAAFSSDESRLVAASDRFIQLWDIEGDEYQLKTSEDLWGKCLYGGHSTKVQTVGFLNGTPNGLISVAGDGVVRTWNTERYGEYVVRMKELLEEFQGKHVPELSRNNAASRHLRKTGVVANRRKSQSTHLQSFQTLAPDEHTTPDDRTTSVVSWPQPNQRARRQGRGHYMLTGGVQSDGVQTENAAAFRRLQGHHTYSAEFSRDSQRVIVGSDQEAAHTFNSSTAEKTASMSRTLPRDNFFAPDRNNFLEGHIPEIVSVQFLPPNGDLLLTLDYFGSISVWDAKDDENGIGFETSRPQPSAPVLEDPSNSAYEVEDPSCELSVSRDGKWVMAGGVRNDGKPKLEDSTDEFFAVIWKTDDLKTSGTPLPHRVLHKSDNKNQHLSRITAAAFSPDATRAITADRRGRFVLWAVDDQLAIAAADGAHNNDLVSGVFFIADDQFISTGFDGNVLRWRISTDKDDQLQLQSETLDRPKSDNPDYIIRLRPNADGSGFITSDLTGRTFKNASDGRKEGSYQLHLNYWSSTDGWQVTLPVQIDAPASEGDLGKPYRHDVSWAPDGKEVLFINDRRLVTIDSTTWKTRDGYELPEQRSAVRGAYAPTSDGSTRVATFDGRFAQLWDMQTGDQVAEFRSHGNQVRASFSADRRYLITASDSIRVFNSQEDDPNHGRPQFRLSRKAVGNRPVEQARFSPQEGNYQFASIDRAGEVKLWDWNSGEGPPATPFFLSGEADNTLLDTYQPNAICWSDNAEYLAAIRLGQLSIWRLNDGQPHEITVRYPEEFDRNDLVLNDLDFSTDASRLTAAGTLNGKSYGLVWYITDDQATSVGQFDEDDLSRYQPESRRRFGDDGPTGITCIAFDDIGGDIITGGQNGQVHRWTHATELGEFVALSQAAEIRGVQRDDFCDSPGGCPPHTAPISDIDVAPNGSILTADEAGFFVIWPPGR